MGKFRKQHGKTRLRTLIEHAKEKGISIPQMVLDIAEVAFPPIGKVRDAIQAVSDLVGIDPLVKNEAIQELDELALELERELTERHSTDMNSDSPLSRNIRPIVAIVLIVDYLCTKWGHIIFSNLNISEHLVNQTFTLLEWVLGFYFGLKGLERISRFVAPVLQKR